MTGFPTIREYMKVLEMYGSYLLKKIDEGKVFKVFEKDLIPAGSTYSILIDNSANNKDIMVVSVKVDSDRSLDIDVLGDVTVTDNGTLLTIKSYNVGDTVSTLVSAYKSPTYTGGTLIDGGYTGGNTGVRAIGGDEEIFGVTKVRAGERIIVQIVNLDGTNDANVKYKIVFFEV